MTKEGWRIESLSYWVLLQPDGTFGDKDNSLKYVPVPSCDVTKGLYMHIYRIVPLAKEG